MSVFELNASQFEAHCPYGIDPGTDIFKSLKQFFDQAYFDLQQTLLGRLLGDELPSLLAGKEEGDLMDASEFIRPLKMSEISDYVVEYVCKRAMFIAIPSLDLVLTPNGFGVVQSRDLAPAIPERVNRLRAQCRIDYDIAFDKLLKGLPGNSLTREKLLNDTSWRKMTSHLLWTSEDFEHYCGDRTLAMNSVESRENLVKNAGKLILIENKMKWAISFGQFHDFIEMMRNNSADEYQAKALGLLFEWLAEAWTSADGSVVRADGILLCYMDENIEHFHSFENSSQYANRHAEDHKKNKECGCFIFR